MTLKTRKDPVLPSPPSKEEVSSTDRLIRWWKGILIVIKDLHANVHTDLSRLEDLPIYANNAAALAAGLSVGDFYRTNSDPDTVCVVH